MREADIAALVESTAAVFDTFGGGRVVEGTQWRTR